jgi:hypothetical protein
MGKTLFPLFVHTFASDPGRLSQICERAIYLMIADKGRTNGDPALRFSFRCFTRASRSTCNLSSPDLTRSSA